MHSRYKIDFQFCYQSVDLISLAEIFLDALQGFFALFCLVLRSTKGKFICTAAIEADVRYKLVSAD